MVIKIIRLTVIAVVLTVVIVVIDVVEFMVTFMRYSKYINGRIQCVSIQSVSMVAILGMSMVAKQVN